MATDERARHQLFRRLEEVLGPDEAEVLMQHLPPVGWADVSTKQDLAVLKRDIEQQLGRLEDRLLAGMDQRLNKVYRTIAFAVPTSILAAVGIALGARGA